MKSRLRVRDLCAEAFAGVVQRPGRTFLTMFGTVLGVGAFVAVLGITATATGQVSQRFTTLLATEVSVEAAPVATARDPAFSADASTRVEALNGVRHAGVYWTVDSEQAGMVAGVLMPGQVSTRQSILAASSGFLQAIGPTMQQGRAYDDYHERKARRVAVLGRAIAAKLGITQVRFEPTVFIGGIPFTVVGIIDGVQRRPEVLLDVIVPNTTAAALWGEPKQPAKMLIETELGAAVLVSSQVALALRPEAPERFVVLAPPDPRKLRDAVNTDLASLFLVLACVCLVIGAAGIANTTMIAVMERVPEIGLRRSLGAYRRHVAAQFLAESGLVGGLGGLLGAGIGSAAVVVVAIGSHWTPIMAPWTVGSAPALGLMTGVLAGLYPAFRAAAVEPVVALRR
jgi:putative ABC transport system permease protein